MKKHLVVSLGLLFMWSSLALVDTKNANYTKTFVDIALPGAGLPLMIERTYNSRSLYKGLFGYGWCSNLETRLEVLPDNTLMVVECGGGVEVSYRSNSAQGSSDLLNQKIMAEVKKKKGLGQKYIAQVRRDLQQSSLLQSELIRAFGLKGKAKSGQEYHAVGRQNEKIRFNGNQYRRYMANGQVQVFNRQGQLIQELDRSGNWIKSQRKKGTIAKVMDSRGRSLRFKWKGKLLRIKGPGKIKAEYTIENDNLVRAVNSKGEKYRHIYDQYHNLTKTVYPNNTFEFLTYNTNKDWVTAFKDRRGCKETYTYQSNKRNKNHYWTSVIKKCGTRVTNRSKYTFWNKKKKDGSLYLHRARQEINGQVSDITYHAETGAPLSITRNRVTIRYAYYPNGFLKSRKEPGKNTFFSEYKGKCKKPSQVVVQNVRARKVVSQVKTQLSYDQKKCHLVLARQSGTGRFVQVKRDHLGRIAEMRDQSKKRILVAYNEKHSKPQKITRPGVGSIQVFYDKEGQVDPGKTQTDPTVAAQVASVFNGFLELISPVATDITI